MIDLLPNDEQQAIWDSAETVLAAEAPLSRLHADAADDAAVLRRTAELGWIGLGLAEADGGVGYGLAEEALIFRAAGRHLLSPTLLGSVLAARIASRAGDAALAAALLSGERRAAILVPLDGRLDAQPSGAFHRLDAGPDDLAVAWSAEGAALFSPLSCNAVVASIDDTVKLERINLDSVRPLHWIAAVQDDIALRATVLGAATLTGLAEAARDMALEYAKMRQQFGQAIGAFQAIKHACADMAVRCESAWSLTAFAALAEDRGDAAFQAHAAWIIAAQAADQNAARNVQVHGGMGFTAECDAQLLVKRARVLAAIGGGARGHKAALLAQPDPAKAGAGLETAA